MSVQMPCQHDAKLVDWGAGWSVKWELMQLIRSPWATVFSDFGRSIRSEAIVAAPFIGAGPLGDLASELNTKQLPKIDLITNLSADSLLHGTVNTEAIAEFSRSMTSVTVRHLPGLHAKVYVADDSLAIITSGNLTQASLYRNYEYGIQITEPEKVRQIAADVREYGSLGTLVSLAELDELTEITRTLRLKYAAVLNTQRHLANKEFQDELEATRDALRTLRAKPGESVNSIFARTILHVLKRGPLTTKEIQPIIEGVHPDICDSSIDRVINGVRFGKRWKHWVRSAQQHLKTQGQIEYVDGKWRLRLETNPGKEALWGRTKVELTGDA